MKNILIFGGTGFIGTHLVELLKEDYVLTVVTRNPAKAKERLPEKVNVMAYPDDAKALAETFVKMDGIINLAGDSFFIRCSEPANSLSRDLNFSLYSSRGMAVPATMTDTVSAPVMAGIFDFRSS